MWVDYRGSLGTVHNDGEVSTRGWIIEVHSRQSTMMWRLQHMCADYGGHSVQSAMMGRFQHVGIDYRDSLSTVHNNGEVSKCG